MGTRSITLLFCLTGGVLVVGALLVLHRSLFLDRSRGRLRCPKCWYDMRAATSLVCPECGHDARTPDRLRKTRRSRRGVVAAMLLAMLAAYLHPVHRRATEFDESWAFAIVPTTALAIGFGWVDEPARATAFKRFDPQSGPARSWDWQDTLLAWRLESLAIADREGLVSLGRLCDLSIRSNAAAEGLARQVAPTFPTHRRYINQLAEIAGRLGAPGVSEVLLDAMESDRLRYVQRPIRSAIARDLRLHAGEYSDELLIRIAAASREEFANTDPVSFDYTIDELTRRRRSWPVLVTRIKSPYSTGVVGKVESETNIILLRATARVEGGEDPIAVELHESSLRNAATGTHMWRADIRLRVQTGPNGYPPVVSSSGRLLLELRDPSGQVRTAGDRGVRRSVPLHGSAEHQGGLLESLYIDPVVVFGPLAPGEYTLTIRHHPYASPEQPDDWFLASPPATFPITIERPRTER